MSTLRQQRLKCRKQGRQGHRFGQIVVGAGRQAALPVTLHDQGGQRKDGRRGQDKVPPEPAGDFLLQVEPESFDKYR